MSGVDLDRLAAGCASVSWHPWSAFPGVTVGVRAMSLIEWADCVRESNERVSSDLRGPVRDVASRHEHVVEVVARTAVMREESGAHVPLTHEDARMLDADALLELYRLAVHEQDAAHGIHAVDDEVTKALDADPRRSMDRARAFHACGLHAYYGTPARALTDWQVIMFLHLVKRDE